MSNETCPHCGAEKEKFDTGFIRYQCGSSMSRHIADDWASSLSSQCYQNQLAQRNAEIDRLRQSVLDEREACAQIADVYALGLERNYSEIIADEIRARGEAK